MYCLSCDGDGICQQSLEGYSVYDGACVKCQVGCLSCVNSGAGSCDLTVSGCKLGFVYNPHTSKNVNYTCAQCATGCTSCSTTDISNCTSCNEGFYPLLESETNVVRCSICMQNCRSCSNSNKCDQCVVGYRLSEDSTRCIEKCDSNCLTCSDNDMTVCTSCYAGNNLEGTECVVNLACNNDKNCTVCGDGYALQNGECLQCNYTDENCEGCEASDLNACFKCRFGSFLSADRQCVQCSSGCTGCLSSEVCYSCDQGFYLGRAAESFTGKCLTCISQCKTCNLFAYLCTSCNAGYILEGSKCISEVHVDYILTIDSPIQEIISLGTTFLSVLVDFAANRSVDPAKPLTIMTNDVTISKLKSGSTVASGSISTFTKAQSDMLTSKISTDLVGIQLEKGYSIISVESTTVTPDDKEETPTVTSSPDSSPKLAILLGVLIPVVVILIAAGIIVAIKCIKKRRGSSNQGPSSKEEYFVNESSKTINRTSEQLERV